MNHADRLVDLSVDVFFCLSTKNSKAFMAEANESVSHLFLSPSLKDCEPHHLVDHRIERVVSG